MKRSEAWPDILQWKVACARGEEHLPHRYNIIEGRTDGEIWEREKGEGRAAARLSLGHGLPSCCAIGAPFWSSREDRSVSI